MKLRFLADRDLSLTLVDGVVRANPDIDFACRVVPDRMPDPEVLLLAREQGRVLVSHDVSTMPGHFARFCEEHDDSPGLILTPQRTPVAVAIQRLLSAWGPVANLTLAIEDDHSRHFLRRLSCSRWRPKPPPRS